MISRRAFSTVLLATVPLVKRFAKGTTITVLKDANCSCCNGWIQHLKDNDFEVVVKEIPTSELRRTKTTLGIPPDLQTCHTATIEGYVIEGHVPAPDISSLLRERPRVTGLVVTGMPVGSPGMEGPKRESFSVLLFDGSRTAVYRNYRAP
jgi:hypothetical protein